MHPLIPDDYSFRSLADDRTLQDRTLPDLGALQVRDRLTEMSMADEVGVERRAFDQSPDPAQHVARHCGDRATEHFNSAGVGCHQPEQQPDRGRLARPIGTEESIHRTARYEEVDGVDSDMLPEPAGEAVRRDRQRHVGRRIGQRRGDRGHKP